MQIYSTTKTYRDSVDDTYFQSKHPTDIKTAIWKHDDKVSIVRSVLLTGHPNEQTLNKRWWRWYTVGSMGFRRNASGTIVVYNCNRTPSGRRKEQFIHTNMHKPLEALSEESELGDAFRDAMWETFNITKQEQFYPMMEKYGLYTHRLIPTSIRSAFKLDNWDAYTEYIFGKNRKPTLVVPVAHTEPYVVALGHQFRGLVGEDTLAKFINNNHFDDEIDEKFKPYDPHIRKILKLVDPASREAIAKRQLDFLDIQRIKMLANRQNTSFGINLKPGTSYGSWSELFEYIYGPRYNTPEYLSQP